MGANLSTRTYKIEDKEEIKKQFAEDVMQSLASDGNSYSGEIGMLGSVIISWKALESGTQDQAEQYIEDHHNKWDGAMAVSFQYCENFKPSASLERKKAKVAELDRKKNEVFREARAKFEQDKSEFVTCKNCKSRLNRSKLNVIKTAYCPLCDHTLLGTTTTNKTKKINGEIEEMQNKIKVQTDIELAKCPKKTGWVVGGWCSC